MKLNLKKIILIILALFILASICVSCAISQNRHHLDECHDPDCAFCETIHIAQKIIYKFFNLTIGVAFIYCISYILTKLVIYSYIAMSRSLIFQNVQLNE